MIPGGNLLLPLALTIVFSLHSVIEGAALGVQTQLNSSFLSILIAIASHKAIEAVSVASNFVKERVELSKAIPIILLYCAMTPIGIVMGMIAGSVTATAHAVLLTSTMQAFAAGSFVYLAVHEVSDERCCKKVSGKWQVLLMLSGLGTMALLALVV